MAPNSGEESTVIAIDGDKNSQGAVRWAVDNILKKNSTCTLIHVRTKALHPHDFDAVPKEGRPPTEDELHQFFLPFRGFCARKGIVAKELVLHDIDVPSALTDYIVDNSISNIVVGASNWNIFRRRFKDDDVPARLIKSVPESCTVYVISKGKVQNVRPAGRSNKTITATKSMKDIYASKESSPPVELSRKSFKFGLWRGSKSFGQNMDAIIQVARRKSNGDSNSSGSSNESCSSHNSSNKSSPPSDDNLSPPVSQLSDTSHENQDGINYSDESLKSLEIEIRKLKHELKKTTRKYSKACKAAIAAKHKAMEIEKLRQEEKRNIENSRLAEEAALSLAEVERLKTKTAMASAEVSKRLAEMEMYKRRQAERRARRKEKERKRASDGSGHIHSQLRMYNIKEIEVATNYFDSALKIGEGGYGPVFKGVLDHTFVAVKALRPDMTQGEKQFQKEVDVLSTIRHPNMVLLLGACPEFGCLVYEYMEYGSLEDRLFQKDNTPPIPWRIRFKIASEIATALHFLHQAKPEPIVHRDLKPANILLDRNYVCKISDVGLARLVPPSVANKTTQYHMTAAAGTFCYIDPEYQQTGMLGVKSDIYSLGVLLLQIITGKPPMGVAHLVEKAINKGKFREVLDPSVADWPVEEALSFARLALKCCEMRKRDRPDLGSVILPELNRLRDLGGSNDTFTADIVPARQMHITRRPNPTHRSAGSMWSIIRHLWKLGLLLPTGTDFGKIIGKLLNF